MKGREEEKEAMEKQWGRRGWRVEGKSSRLASGGVRLTTHATTRCQLNGLAQKVEGAVRVWLWPKSRLAEFQEEHDVALHLESPQWHFGGLPLGTALLKDDGCDQDVFKWQRETQKEQRFPLCGCNALDASAFPTIHSFCPLLYMSTPLTLSNSTSDIGGVFDTFSQVKQKGLGEKQSPFIFLNAFNAFHYWGLLPFHFPSSPARRGDQSAVGGGSDGPRSWARAGELHIRPVLIALFTFAVKIVV
ncbi:Protein of unknown function [Gryllus bimaculatus]|nr:Protein of unknown function [Gryllus bimaculatus]